MKNKILHIYCNRYWNSPSQTISYYILNYFLDKTQTVKIKDSSSRKNQKGKELSLGLSFLLYFFK